MKTIKTSKWDKKTYKNNKEWEAETQDFNKEKKIKTSPETNVSVFTKTTNPKIIIKSEIFKNNNSLKKVNTHAILKFLCLSIICIIILITFFLSLKTYNMIHELQEHIIP